jgi:hypothetical protein
METARSDHSLGVAPGIWSSGGDEACRFQLVLNWGVEATFQGPETVVGQSQIMIGQNGFPMLWSRHRSEISETKVLAHVVVSELELQTPFPSTSLPSTPLVRSAACTSATDTINRSASCYLILS